MVRSVRAKGSKGSNKKIVLQLKASKKKRKNNQNAAERKKKDGNVGHAAVKKRKIATGKQGTRPQNAFQTTKNQKTDKETKEQPVPSVQNANKKRKEGKKKVPKTSKHDYAIDSEGKRAKVVCSSTEKSSFDLPCEENGIKTEYEDMWVKKVQRGELDRLRAKLEKEGLNQEKLKKRMKKAKGKANWNLKIELMLQQIMQKHEAADKKDKNVELIQQIMQKRVAVFKKGINSG